MSILIIRLIVILIVSFLSTPVFSATYYVDYVAGADTNNGTDTSTPFQHSPGDLDATNNANITLSAGDTVVFRGGVTYAFDGTGTDRIVANASGTSGNVITYISGHVFSPTWGTGRAVIDVSNADPAGAGGLFDLVGYSFLTIQGLEITGYIAAINNTSGIIGWRYQIASCGSGCGNVIIDNNYLHVSGTNGIFIQGEFEAQTPTNFTIQNNILEETNGHGIMLRYGITTALILNNTFDLHGVQVVSGTTGADSIALSYETCCPNPDNEQTGIVIRGNTFNDTSEANPSYSASKGHILFQQNTTGTIVEDNFFYGELEVAALLITGIQTDLIIRNNVFHHTNVTHEGSIRFRTDQANPTAHDNIDILNNTFVVEQVPGPGAILYFHEGNSDIAPQMTNVDIRNNIIDSDTDTVGWLIYIDDEMGSNDPVVELSTLTIDNNSYQSGKASPFFINEASRTFTQWRSDISASTGDDANSNFGQVSFVDEGNNDFNVSSGDTEAIGQGTDLSGQGFSDDKDGTSRPQGSAWDIGAYEFLVRNIFGVTFTGASIP